MKKLALFQQKQIVTDKATCLSGRLQTIQIETNGCIYYSFVPVRLNPDTQLPNRAYWITAERIQKGKTHEVELPLEIIGRDCKDVVSGVQGMAITMSLHINGCVHVDLQPSGATKTGEPIERWNCSIRDLDPATQKLIPDGWAFNPDKPSPSAPCRSYMA